MTNEPKDLLEIAIRLARGAGEIVQKGVAARLLNISTKTTITDPVTEIDKASESFIVSQLQTLRPEDGILGEEGASVTSSNGVEWVIDPIDGTVNFIYGIPFYAVSVGVSVNGTPTAGAVYNPAIDEMFTGALGLGAYLNGKSIHTSEVSELSIALVATGFSYSPEVRARQGALLAELVPKVRDIRRMGSAALEICNVACGRTDAYFEDRVSPWDAAAGSVILTEAGGIITGFDGGLATRDALCAATAELYKSLRDEVVQ